MKSGINMSLREVRNKKVKIHVGFSYTDPSFEGGAYKKAAKSERLFECKRCMILIG